MIMTDEQELAFLEELRKYENKWVAIFASGESEVVVGSGQDAIEATREAEAKGFKDTVLFYVRPFDRGFVGKGSIEAPLFDKFKDRLAAAAAFHADVCWASPADVICSYL
jgi:NADPH-dependent glutamate synthase beta subunit-like oxidoreductase